MKTNKVKHEGLKKLILQVLNEPELLPGAYDRFGKILEKHSGIKMSRSKIWNWVHGNGVPPNMLQYCVELSERHSKRKKDILTIVQLRDFKSSTTNR